MNELSLSPAVEAELAELADLVEAVPEGQKDTGARRWMVTAPARLFETDPAEVDGVARYSLLDLQDKLKNYLGWAGQIEVAPSTGYLHWQLYLESKSAIKFETLRALLPQTRLSKARKPRLACVRYCSKEDTRYPGLEPVFAGDLPLEVTQGKRNDLAEIHFQMVEEKKSVHELLLHDHRLSGHLQWARELENAVSFELFGKQRRQVEVEYIYGETSTGKTMDAEARFGWEDAFWVGSYGTGAFDGYSRKPVLVLDEFRSSIPLTDMLRILRGSPLSIGARYLNRWAGWTKVVIISNWPPHKQFPTAEPEDRRAFMARLHRIRHYTAPGEFTETLAGTATDTDDFSSVDDLDFDDELVF